jgi:heme/copper-type cytochrome/quinol oxidase subunit 2
MGILILGGGVVYRVFLLPEKSVPVITGKVRELTIIAKKDEWRFIPEIIEAERGDKIVATIINEDNYDHGIAIDAFGVSQRMPANSTIKIEFVVTQEGDFPFYCSVPCGEGEVEGKKRGHFDMVGKIHVRSIISETQ